MNYRFVRDSFVGRLIYHLSSHKYFSYPEEALDYVVPPKYCVNSSTEKLPSDNVEPVIVTWDGEDDPETRSIGQVPKRVSLFSRFLS